MTAVNVVNVVNELEGPALPSPEGWPDRRRVIPRRARRTTVNAVNVVNEAGGSNGRPAGTLPSMRLTHLVHCAG